MILATRGRNVELREWGNGAWRVPISRNAGVLASSGQLVGIDDALGLPAMAAAFRIPSELIACMPLRVWRQGQPPARVDSSWQARLLDQPSLDCSSFDVWSDTVAAIDTTGNAFLERVSYQGEVIELRPIDPEFVQVVVGRTGAKRIQARTVEGVEDITERVIHIRGWRPRPGHEGYAVPAMHKDAIGAALGLQDFEGRFFRNDATPGVVLKVPGRPTTDQRRELRESWEQRHSGSRKAHGVGVIWGGTEIEVLGRSPAEAQAVEAQAHNVRQAGRMQRVHPSLLGDPASTRAASVEQDAAYLERFSLMPRMRRIEEALRHDAAIFGGTDLFPRFDTSALTRADQRTLAEVWHKLRQAGLVTANEGRAEALGLPPVDGGDELQSTPVGGAPNAGAPEPDPTPPPAA